MIFPMAFPVFSLLRNIGPQLLESSCWLQEHYSSLALTGYTVNLIPGTANAITDYPKHFHSWPLNPTLALWNGNGNGNTHSHTRNLVSLISMHYMLANLDGLWFWPIARVLHIWFWLYILAMFSWLYDLGVYFRYFEHFQFMRLSLK